MKKRLLKKESFSNLLPCIFYGLICGVLTGAFIVLFKFIAKQRKKFQGGFLKMQSLHPCLLQAFSLD